MSESVAIIATVFLVLLILFFNNITFAVSGAFMSVFSPVRAREYKDDRLFKQSGIISFLIAVPLTAFCLYACKITDMDFLTTIPVLFGAAFFSHLSDAMLSALDSKYNFVEEIRSTDTSIVIISILSIPAVILFLMIEPESNLFAKIWIGGISAICIIIRYYLTLRRLFSLKFSRFFTFLYLCGFKILPIAVVVKVLVI